MSESESIGSTCVWCHKQFPDMDYDHTIVSTGVFLDHGKAHKLLSLRAIARWKVKTRSSDSIKE